MRIYICAKETLDRESIRTQLHLSLKKYYGKFSTSDIEFFGSNDASPAVYVMDKTPNSKHNSSIIEAITKAIGCPVDVKLNYQTINPNFRPKTQLQPHASSPAKAQDDSQKLEEFDYEKLSLNYHAETPHYTFEQVILPDETRNNIFEAIATIEVEEKVFDEWGLRAIIPYAASALNFYGSPGTGKTMAAEAVAAKLKKKFIRASYADIESKYHGEGPKMVKAIFHAAEREDAILFLDESDSLLSKRLTDVRSGSEQAINSMRSQLLICLEQFRGIVIFATNLVVNYDRAFLSRLISIEFPVPDAEARRAIWERHLHGEGLHIPLADDVDTKALADAYNFCGREIKNAVKDACVRAAMHNTEPITQADLMKSCEKVKTKVDEVSKAEDHTQSILKDEMQKQVDSRKAS